MLLFYLISFIVPFSLFFFLFVKKPQEAALPHCIKHTMIIKETSPIALLHAAASECHLQYVSLITEIATDQLLRANRRILPSNRNSTNQWQRQNFDLANQN